MAGNFKQEGDTLEFTAPVGGVVSGNAYLIGGLLVVALVTAAAGAKFNGKSSGVFELSKTSAQAWTEGQKVYRNAADGKMDSDSTTGPLVGVAAAAAANPTATGLVRLNGTTASFSEGQQAAIVDLTDNTGFSGTHDDTLAATVVPADIAGGEPPTEAEHNAVLALLRVMAQNASDSAQKIKELRAALAGAGITA